jgi:hypothetical protein
MGRCAFFLTAVLAGGVILSNSSRALAQKNRLEIPREALGFQGRLSAEVVKAPDPRCGVGRITSEHSGLPRIPYPTGKR